MTIFKVRSECFSSDSDTKLKTESLYQEQKVNLPSKDSVKKADASSQRGLNHGWTLRPMGQTSSWDTDFCGFLRLWVETFVFVLAEFAMVQYWDANCCGGMLSNGVDKSVKCTEVFKWSVQDAPTTQLLCSLNQRNGHSKSVSIKPTNPELITL